MPCNCSRNPLSCSSRSWSSTPTSATKAAFFLMKFMAQWNFHSLNDENAIFHRGHSSPTSRHKMLSNRNIHNTTYPPMSQQKLSRYLALLHHWNAPPLIPSSSFFCLIDVHQNISTKTATPLKMHPKKEPGHSKCCQEIKPTVLITCKQTNKGKIAIETQSFLSYHHQLPKVLSCSTFNSWWYCSINLGFHHNNCNFVQINFMTWSSQN